jgi:uncharacterized membrane protein YgdD (TMEM256/DUF423 family)
LNRESSKNRILVRVLGGLVFLCGFVPLAFVLWRILSRPGLHVSMALLFNLAPLALITGLWIVIGWVLMKKRKPRTSS